MKLIELAILTAGNRYSKKSEIVRDAQRLLMEAGVDLGKDREYLVAIDHLTQVGYMRWDGPALYHTSVKGNEYLREKALPVFENFVQEIRYNFSVYRSTAA